MNKKFFATALVALSAAIATPMFAQNTNAAKNGKPACEQKCDMKKDQKARNPFEGLNLTADQQQKLEALKAECAQQKQAAKEARQADKAAKKQAAKEARAQHLAKIKTILTPEQYVTFLENNFLSKDAMHKDKMHKGDKNKKGQRDGKNDRQKENRGNREKK